MSDPLDLPAIRRALAEAEKERDELRRWKETHSVSSTLRTRAEAAERRYEELRRLIDGGSEAMTHEDAVREVGCLTERAEAAEARCAELEAGLRAARSYLPGIKWLDEVQPPEHKMQNAKVICPMCESEATFAEFTRGGFGHGPKCLIVKLDALLAPAPIPGPMLPPLPGATVEEVERMAMCNAAVPAELKPCVTCGGSGRVEITAKVMNGLRPAFGTYDAERDVWYGPCDECRSRKRGGA